MPDIIVLCETKLKNSFLYFLDGYKFIQSNSDTNTGGVGLFIRSNINFIVIDQYKLLVNVPNCENLWIEVKQKNSKRNIFGVIYRHPNHHITDFHENSEKLLKLNKNNLSCYICGDINVDLLKCNEKPVIQQYTDYLVRYGMYQYTT